MLDFLKSLRPLDWLYPPLCSLCDKKLANGRALCEPCVAALPRIKPPFCEKCGEAFDGKIDGQFTCPNCSGLKFDFEAALASLDRSDNTLALVHRLKYLRHLYIADELGRLAAEVFWDERFAVALEERWPLVPVPLHRSRERKRQFNQAEVIAKGVSKCNGLEVVSALKRVRKTTTQTRLSRKERMANLRGAFEMKHEINAPGVVLVDDVFTTGSTVQECAKVLRKSGVPRVLVLTVSRG